jgi:hypothetical protein
MHNSTNDSTRTPALFKQRGSIGPAIGAVNPEVEDDYWRNNYQDEAYYKEHFVFEDYQPAYRLGYLGPDRFHSSFEDAAPQLNKEWDAVKGKSRLSWDHARMAIRAAWDKVDPTA